MKTFSLLFFILISATKIFAVDFTVTRNDDRNLACVSGVDCSLREAVNAANLAPTDDLINFAQDLTVITLANQIVISDVGTLNIVGLGASNLTVQRFGFPRSVPNFRIFLVESNANVMVSGLTITGGDSGTGGGELGGHAFLNYGNLAIADTIIIRNSGSLSNQGVINNLGTITITNSLITQNSSLVISGIINSGTLTMTNSTVSENGVLSTNSVAGISNNGTATIINSTFSGNDTSSTSLSNASVIANRNNMTIRGSTIHSNRGNASINNSGNLTLTNTTVSSNLSPGIRNAATLNLTNCTVANNVQFGIFTTGTANIGNTIVTNDNGTAIQGEFTSLGNNIAGGNPKLAPLSNNGGATLTHALLPDSPAIDAGNNSLVTEAFDQRGEGFPRIVQGNRPGAAIVDIGAFEAPFGTTAATVSVSGRVTAGGRKGVSNATVHLTTQSGETQTTRTNRLGYYSFPELATGETYIFNVYSKRYQFTPKVVSLTEEIAELDFTAQ